MRVVSKLVVVTMVALALACDKSATPSAAMHEGQGEEVTVDPAFEIKIKIADGPEGSYSARIFAIYEAKPPKPGDTGRPQGFELRGEQCVIAGRLPAELKLAPKTEFAQLIGKPLSVLSLGGDPTAPAMTKFTTADGKTFTSKKGTATVDKAFFKKGQYAGVSGALELELQEIKLGDSDDPNSKGDQPIGDPVKATGRFSARAQSFPYEQL